MLRRGASLLSFALLLSLSGSAFAQEAQGEAVSPTAKGVVGGALLGGELVMIGQAIGGVHKTWPYLLFGGLGAVAGGVGGYFVEQNVSDGRIPVYMLAGGLILVLPTTVLTLNATRYRPSDTYRENQAPTNLPADPGSPGGSPVTPAKGAEAPRPVQSASGSLLAVRHGALQLGVPVPEVRPVFTAKQRMELGVQQATEVRMPLVNVSF